MTPRGAVAVVGAGRWGRNHVRTLAQLNCLSAVVEPSQENRDALELSSEIPFFDRLEDLLDAKSDTNGVVIATPAETHSELAETCLRAQLPVLVEKPLTLSVDDAESLVSVAETEGQILMVGHLLLFQPAIQWMRQAIVDGQIGNVQHIECRRLNLGTVRTKEDVFWSFAPHDLSVIHYLSGEPQLTNATAHQEAFLQPSIADLVHASLRFDNGVTGHIQASWIWPEKLRTTTVIGSAGAMVYNELENTVTIHKGSIDSETLNTVQGPQTTQQFDAIQPLREELQHFIQCIAQQETPIPHGRHALEVVKMLKAVEDAAYV